MFGNQCSNKAMYYVVGITDYGPVFSLICKECMEKVKSLNPEDVPMSVDFIEIEEADKLFEKRDQEGGVWWI